MTEQVREMSKVIAQDWFEMRDLRKRRFATAVWIPLRASETLVLGEKVEETLAAASVAFPADKRADAEQLGWSRIGLMHSGGPYAFRDHAYKPAEVYQFRDGEDMGVEFVFEQHLGSGHGAVWHLSQDLVLALGLLQEGDSWVRPAEDYVEVVRQRRDTTGRVIAIEIRSEFLRDYLEARGLALRLAYYRQRMAVLPNASHILWPDGELHEEQPHDRFTGHVFAVDSKGGRHGGGVALFHVWRTDVDPDEDVPVFGPENASNTAGESRRYTQGGQKLYRIEGELWREEWIEPAERSERVRGDEPIETISFVVDASGRREGSAKLNDQDIGRYLWFDPRVITAVARRRGGGFRWYTQYTGSVWANKDWPVHFGLNRLGLVNVYAYDVAKLPNWQQRIWRGFNLSPDGAVSGELLDAQMKARPASTKASEAVLPELMNALDGTFEKWTGAALFQKHASTSEIIREVHRFRTLEPAGVYALAKDLARLIVDRIDVNPLQKIAAPPKGEKWGSLKSLEKALATLVPADTARELLGPLVGIYELRLGDAHLPSRQIAEAFELIDLDANAPAKALGEELIARAVTALAKMGATVSEHAPN
jgi:hypothetical protein